MTFVKTAFVAPALVALAVAFSSGAASASSCNIAAAEVTGDGHFVDLTVKGCGYTSLDMQGSYSFADIINAFGALVAGIEGNGNYYQVVNVGDNRVGTWINGFWHETTLDIRGDNNDVVVEQSGRPSSVDVKVDGDDSTIKVKTN
jgi:hypothetical protein